MGFVELSDDSPIGVLKDVGTFKVSTFKIWPNNHPISNNKH